MKIVLITQILPYPPNAGPRVKTWNVLRHLLDRGHEVTLVSYVREEERPYLPVLEMLCAEVHAIPINRSRWKDIYFWLKSHLSGRPFLVERDDLPAMRSTVHQLVGSGEFDAMHMDQVTMAQFAPRADPGKCIRVFDAHNATWTILDRMRQSSPLWMKPLLAMETKRMLDFETRVIERCDWTLAVTEIDRRALSRNLSSNGRAADNFAVIPIAVDTEDFEPVRRDPGAKKVFTFGTLHYAPNADGIRWFLAEVWPRVQTAIPDAELTITGANPPEDFLHLANNPGSNLTVTGYVEDLIPYFEQASVLVVPVLSGSGMRVRILESMSRAMPLVSTTIGVEGIDVEHGTHLLVANEPEEFARCVVRLMVDTGFQKQLGENARRLATSRYDWRVALNPLDRIYPPA